MTGNLTWLLMLMSLLCLIGLGVSGVLVSKAQERRQRLARRFEETVAPYRKTKTIDILAYRPAPPKDRSLAETVAGVFAFHPDRLDQYPVRWWAVLAVTFVIALFAARLIASAHAALGIVSMPVLWVIMSRAFFGWVGGRRRDKLLQQFPDALAMMVRSVQVGIPVLGALNSVAHEAPEPTSVEFSRLAAEVAMGNPLDEAAAEMGRRNDLSEYRFFAIVIGLQAQTGGGLSETLDNLADLIRKRLALRERGKALSAEARSSALILTGLPIAMGAGLGAMNPAYMAPLFYTREGKMILGAAALLLTFGTLSIRFMIKRSLT